MGWRPAALHHEAAGCQTATNVQKQGTSGRRKEDDFMLLILLLVVLLLAVTPRWPYSRRWGYYPSGSLGVVLAIVIVLMLLGTVRL